MPAPMTATVTCLLMSSDSCGSQGLARAGGDRVRAIEVARVEVVLDDDEGVSRQRAQRDPEVLERGHAEARLAHDVALDGVGERQPVGLDFREYERIDGFDMDVPDSVGVNGQQAGSIPVCVGDMPRVKAKPDEVTVRV